MTDTKEFWQQRLQEAVGHPDMGFEKVDPKHKEIIDRFIPKDAQVIDICCGIGRCADWFENYTGVDWIPEFVVVAAMRHEKKRFYCKDVTKALEWATGTFDWAVMISATLDIKRLPEVRRIAKHVLILNYTNPDDYEVVHTGLQN